jgi:hypothetical protein
MNDGEMLSRAIPMNAAQIAPVIHIRATIGRNLDGSLSVTNHSSEIDETSSAEERERRNQVGEKLSRFVGGDSSAWDSELQQQYETERDHYLFSHPEDPAA